MFTNEEDLRESIKSPYRTLIAKRDSPQDVILANHLWGMTLDKFKDVLKLIDFRLANIEHASILGRDEPNQHPAKSIKLDDGRSIQEAWPSVIETYSLEQEEGDKQDVPMSQDATTVALNKRVSKSTPVILGDALIGSTDLTNELHIALKFGDTDDSVVRGNDPRLSAGNDANNWGDHREAGYAMGTTKIVAGNGLSGGGDLKQDRTLEVRYGTTAGTSAQGNDTRIVNAVQRTGNETISGVKNFSSFPTSPAGSPTTDYQFANKLYVDGIMNNRSIIAGPGLTGGGKLNADRTISANFGTTAGTVMEGNDTRVVNALNKNNVVQNTGQSTTSIMSQKAVTDALGNIGGSSAMGTPDRNNILFKDRVKDSWMIRHLICEGVNGNSSEPGDIATKTYATFFSPTGMGIYGGNTTSTNSSNFSNPIFNRGSTYYHMRGIQVTNDRGNIMKALEITRGSDDTPGIHVHNSMIVGGSLLCKVLGAPEGLWGKQLLIPTGSGPHTAKILSNGVAHFVDVNITSDSRYKSDLKVIDRPLEKLGKVNGYSYFLHEEEGCTDISIKRSAGVIAQEIAEVIPEIVHREFPTGKLSVAYSGVSALLIESVKELSNELEDLKREVLSLRKEIKELKNV